MRRWWRVLGVAVVAAILLHTWVQEASEKRLLYDARENLAMGLNLANYGVLALMPKPPSTTLTPTNRRDPLPPVVLALYLKGAKVLHLAPLRWAYLVEEGPGARVAKLSNIFWAILLSVAAFLSINTLTNSFPIALAGTLLIGLTSKIDTLFTELPGAALLLLTSYFLMMAVRTARPLHYLGAGLSLGALILTKAIFLYIGAALIAGLVFWTLWRWRKGVDVRANARGLLVLTMGTVLLVGPWMARNYYHFGTTQITQRGGMQLMVRAKKDQMTRTEYLGAFYVWAPTVLRDTVGELLGFSRQDLKRGGRLQRLNRSRSSEFENANNVAAEAGKPEATFTYFAEARAEVEKVRLELEKAGHPEPDIAADEEIKRRAIRMFFDHPLRHAAVTLPVLWRGAAFLLPALVLFLGFALALRRVDLVAFALPSLALIVLPTLMTHNNPRFMEYAGPVAIVGLIFVAYHLALWLWRRRFIRVPATAPA